MTKNFVVYKSSAGSGKTTTLVKEYLKLTLKNPGLFNSVLAITFTNKAAAEMKNRILETLRKIIAGETTGSIIASIVRETGITNEKLLENARQLLFFIDHRYDEFSVNTIDAFVHKIIRTFAVDLQLPQNFEVVIDTDDYIPFIVEDIYKQVGIDEDFTNILTHFVLSRVEDEQKHDISGTLADFIKNQLSEESFAKIEILDKLSATDFINIIEKLQMTLAVSKQKITKAATAALESIASEGIVASDFAYGKANGAFGYFSKVKHFSKLNELVSGKRAINAFENDKQWYSGKASADIIYRIAKLKPLLTQYYNEIASEAGQYIHRRLIYNSIYEVALVSEIRTLFDLFTARTQKVHISEFNKRIAKEITLQPVPYIYERLGRRYTHFLIDEFQDTSVLQWNNLLPLVEESLANNNFNMLVGDAKQAIYRFRGGEVELFTHLPSMYQNNESQQSRLREKALRENYHEKYLDTNYRSRNNIIEFNNRFFDIAKSSLSPRFQPIYNKHEQKIPTKEKSGGLISFRLLQADNTAGFQKKCLEEILQIVVDLTNSGFAYGQIAVLSLANKEASTIAGHLLQHGIPVVSSESVLLTSSADLRFLVAFLFTLANTNRQNAMAELMYLFLLLHNKTDEFHHYYLMFSTSQNVFNKLIQHFGYHELNYKNLRNKPVYEICEDFIRHFYKNEPTNLFLRFFLDFVFEKQNIHDGDLVHFLELWEEKKSKLSIAMSEDVDAVQIMTAHKAKGLKFDVVIANLSKSKSGAKLTKKQYWDTPELRDISELKLSLYPINQSLTLIEKGDVYDEEKAKTDLDFLNLIYVAFTRPVHALYAIGHIDKKGNPDLFSVHLQNYLKSEEYWEEDRFRYHFGTLPVSQPEKRKGFLGKILSATPSLAWDEQLQIAGIDEGILIENQELPARRYGILLHNILSEVYQANDLPKVINSFVNKGLLDVSLIKKVDNILFKVVSHPQLSVCFAPGTVIKTETDIFDKTSNKLLRADRVAINDNTLTIIDYKTGKKTPSHQRQIREYGNAFEQLGYKNIRLKLAYLGEEVEVDEIS